MKKIIVIILAALLIPAALQAQNLVREYHNDGHRDNGELPYIQPLKDWKRKREFPLAFNPELAAN